MSVTHCKLLIGLSSDAKRCLLCAEEYLLEEGVCKATCSAGYIVFPETRSCFKCIDGDPNVATRTC